MDPLITNGIDPALLRIVDRRGQQREAVPRRKRSSSAESPAEANNAADSADKNKVEPDPDAPKHTLDDLA